MPPRVTVGVSLKMYFGHQRALDWFARVCAIAEAHPAVAGGAVEFFVIPGYLQILPALGAFYGTATLVGAQDVATEDEGAFTGEVSAAELAEVGVAVAEVGHAERRHLFGDTNVVVGAKTRAALRNSITPVLCLGETEQLSAAAAADAAITQLDSALDGAPAGRVIVAYEPVWAIGEPEPAPVEHIREVAHALRARLDELETRHGSVIIYGGAARPGLLTTLGDSVDGVFLGRFAHDPDMLEAVLREAASMAERRAEATSSQAAIGNRIEDAPPPATGVDVGAALRQRPSASRTE